MDVQQRGRSPSAGRVPGQRIRQSPSPAGLRNPVANINSQTFNPSTSQINGGGGQYNLSSTYLNAPAPPAQFSSHVLPSNDFGEQNFGQPYQHEDLGSGLQHGPSQLNAQTNQQFQSDTLNVNQDFPNYHQQHSASNNFILDPQLQANGQQSDQSINPADLMSNMSSPQVMHPSPPSLMPPHAHSSEPTSPFSNPGQHWSPSHSRQGSLDPSSALMNGQQNDWAGLLSSNSFTRHRRAPSEYSDVSSSVAPSPNVAQSEFDGYDRSPLVQPQPENQNYTDGLNIEGFSLSDPPHRTSPGHSPFVSPMISPQPGLGAVQDSGFVLNDPKNDFDGVMGAKAYARPGEQFPQFPPEQRLGSNDFVKQGQLVPPPEINVEFAPPNNPSQRPFEHPRIEGDYDSLSPPDRGRRNRMRAASDPYISHPVTPSSPASTLDSNGLAMQRNRSNSLSPNDHWDNSRESSPGPRSPSQQRRSSTSSIEHRSYILDLADPNRTPGSGTEKRVQKHPATFQCHLCPKKFTRAYNLRSHLRTHTDERPFVCNVCSKAFARQHDRKRHEGLHSGEKKFVCRGELGNATTWGCGRRFARADALGRHFRSEAGRVCIKPLLDEEAMERQRTMDEHMMNQNMMGGLAPQAAMNGVNQGVFTLPAALLQQYPALQGLQWDQLSTGPDEGDISGRSSFDASSGGDYYDEDDEGSGYVSDNPLNPGFETGGVWQGGQGWKSDIEV